MGAILLKEEHAHHLKVGDHGTTFGGNAVCAAAANAVLDHLEEPGFLDDVAAKGLTLQRGLKKLARKHKGVIAEVRGLGLMIGVEFRGPAAPVLKGLKEKGHPRREGGRPRAAAAAAAGGQARRDPAAAGRARRGAGNWRRSRQLTGVRS